MNNIWIIDTKQIEGKDPDFQYPCGVDVDGDEDSQELSYALIDEEIGLHLNGINTERLDYIICVNNFGWRKIYGVKKVPLSEEADMLEAILPQCDCTFKVWFVPTGALVQNFHHDSPVGDEWYEVRVDNE